MIAVEVVSTFAGLAGIEAEWNALAERYPTPLLRHEWFLAAAQAFARDGELAVFVARQGGRARAIAPLATDRWGGTARLTFLGHQATEPEAFLSETPEALAAVCTAIRRTGQPLLLKRLASDSKEMRALGESLRGRGVLVPRPDSTRTAFVPLETSPEALEAKMSGHARSHVRRPRRAMEKAGGPVVFEAVAPDENVLAPQLERLFRIEAAGWKSRNGTAIVQDEAMLRFYTGYARVAAKLGILRLFFLRAGEATVAAQMHVEFARRLWSLKIGHDEAWSRFSAGRLLTHDILRHGCERGLEAVEFLGVAEEWQRRWPIVLRQHSTLRWYPLSPGGGLALAADATGFVARRVSGEAKRDRARFIPGPQDGAARDVGGDRPLREADR